MTTSTNPIILKDNSKIGQVAAEADDEFLFNCFVDSLELSELKNIESPKMLLLGSTGAGKTAIVKKIERDSKCVNLIQLQEMAFSYIGNSDVINFLTNLGIDLDLFFQTLWKHVIIIEYIRLKFNVENEVKSRSTFTELLRYFSRDEKKYKSIEYLEQWENKFWIPMDEHIREITQKFESDVKASLGVDINKFNARAGYIRSLSGEKKQHLKRLARNFVSPELLTKLSKVIKVIKDYEQKKVPVFILIDRLDENWIDQSIKYPLIRALIESLKGLRGIKDLKVVVALRSDLLEKVILETKEAGFQSEKYEDYIVRLKWNNEQLKSLLDKRINFLYKKKYSKENVFFDDIFPEKMTNTDKPLQAILKRTLYRPRDAINFVNMCLEEAASKGDTTVLRKHFLKAEINYSENRRIAMKEEWQSVISNTDAILEILKYKREKFELSELCSKDLLEHLYKHYPSDNKGKIDELWDIVDEGTKKNIDYFELAKVVISRLYLMGVVGIKIDSQLTYQYFYITQKPLLTAKLDRSTKIKIHPMLHSALAVIK